MNVKKLTPAKMESLFAGSLVREYPEHHIVLFQGEPVDNLYTIEKGYVKVTDVNASGDEQLLLILGPGDIFPLVGTFRAKTKLHYFYETLEPAKLRVVSQDVFVEALERNHDFTLAMLDYFVTRTKELMSRLNTIEASSAKHKIAQVFMYLVQTHATKHKSGKHVIRIPLTHQMIANMTGITRETTSTYIKELEMSGVIHVAEHIYTVERRKLEEYLHA